MLVSTIIVCLLETHSEEEKCFPLRATIAAKQCEKEVEDFLVLTCEVEYFDVLNCKPEKLTHSFSIKRSQSCHRPVPHVANNDIVLHTLRCEVADTLGKATERADKGELQAAREMLHHCKGRVKKSVVFATPLARHLVATIDESLGGLESTLVFQEHGKPTMMNYTHSHWQQRSSCNPSMENYCAAKQSRPSSRTVPVTGSSSGASASPLAYADLTWDNPYVNSSKTRMQMAFKKGKKK